MAAREFIGFLVLCSVSGCTASADPTFKDPAACAAAFEHFFESGKGTPLASDPRFPELKMRALFEREKLERTTDAGDANARVVEVRSKLTNNPAMASDLATHCAAEEASTTDFDRERPRLRTKVASAS